MQRKSAVAAAIAALAMAGGTAVAAPSAFAAPCTGSACSGTVTGQVTVATSLTLALQNNTFSVANAQPGVSYNGIPATLATIYSNDAGGYSLTEFMNDPALANAPSPAQCVTDAFNATSPVASIPDDTWTVTSTGGPGAAGTKQTFPEETVTASNAASGYTCSNPVPSPVTIGNNGGMSAGGGDTFTEQLAVTVPGNTPGGDTFNGTLTIAAIGS